jgi:hypothetical protein
MFMHLKAIVIQCAIRCKAAKKNIATERFTVELLREHQRQIDSCAIISSCFQRLVPREVWLRTFGGITLVYFQNRNAIRRKYSDALLRHFEKLKEKERKAAERLEKRSRIWTVVSAAVRRILCSSAYSRILLSLFSNERREQTCRTMLGIRVLASVQRRAYCCNLVIYMQLICYVVSGLHRRAYVRAFVRMMASGEVNIATLDAPTPPWLEVTKMEKKRTIDRLKQGEKWFEFFSKHAALQPSPAAFLKHGTETESGLDTNSFHGHQAGSFPPPKKEPPSFQAVVPAATTPSILPNALFNQGFQDARSSVSVGLKPLAPNVK